MRPDDNREGNRFDSGILQKLPTIVGSFFILGIMFYVYIIFSAVANKYYVGSSQNVRQRLDDHLNSRSKYTKMAKDWELKYTESFETRSQAYQREMEIKKKKSRVFIET